MSHRLFVVSVVTALSLMFGALVLAQETLSRQYREALLGMQVRGGVMNEAQKQTILKKLG